LDESSWQLIVSRSLPTSRRIVLVVAVATAFSMYRLHQGYSPLVAELVPGSNSASYRRGYSQQQQMISYWNQRVELNKARWNRRCARLSIET